MNNYLQLGILSARYGVGVLGLLVWGAGVAGANPTFTPVQAPVGTASFFVNGVSDDGQSVVGTAYSSGGRSVGVRKRVGSSYELFGVVGGLEPASLAAVSGDGNHAVGSMLYQSHNVIRAYRMEDLSQPVHLTTATGFFDSRPTAVSRDGSVVVGYSNNSGSGLQAAVRWSVAGGTENLGYLRAGPGFQSSATAVSADGNTVAGYSISADNTNLRETFLWRQGAGMQVLPAPAGSDNVAGTDVGGMSNNGQFIVGKHSAGGQAGRGVVWNNGSPLDIGLFQGVNALNLTDVSDNGQRVVGYSSSGAQNTAIIWTPQRGVETLAFYLYTQGVSIPNGTILTQCAAITPDGLTFAGTYTSGTGNFYNGFIATIPGVGSVGVLAGLGVVWGGRRRR